MKKYIKVLVLLAVAVSLVACGKGKEESSGNDDQLNIVTSFYPMYDFTKNVVGDKANISILIDGGVDSHDYEPSAKDMAKIHGLLLLVHQMALENNLLCLLPKEDSMLLLQQELNLNYKK